MTYYAVCNVNGPISVFLDANNVEDALAEFEAGDHQAWIDEPRMDAEDDLGIDGDGMSEESFREALEAAGCRQVRDMDVIENAHAGTAGHLEGGWMLWECSETPSYTLHIYYRECGNWMGTGDPVEEYDDLGEAKNAAQGAEGGDYGPGEYRAVITDDDGVEVYAHAWKTDPNQDLFDAATWLIEDEGEYSTEYYGIGENGEYLHTTQNGGSRGAHSRQEGDGRWSNMADEIEEISLATLIMAVISVGGMGIVEAAKVIAKAHPKDDVDDVILGISDGWEWSDEDRGAVAAWIEKDDPIYGDKIKAKLTKED